MLYQGDLLPDDPFADALAPMRTALRQRFVDGALRLAAVYEQSADHPARIEALRRALAIEPALEPAHQSLMSALAQAGRPHEALEQFAECVRALHELLGVEPSLATRKLRRAIASGEIAASALPSAPLPAAEAPPHASQTARAACWAVRSYACCTVARRPCSACSASRPARASRC